jgi:hypothetical protein
MADLLFIVSRSQPKRYMYLKHAYEDEGKEVILDRRGSDRRRSQRPPPTFERRHVERRHRDITPDLLASGWAVLRRLTK